MAQNGWWGISVLPASSRAKSKTLNRTECGLTFHKTISDFKSAGETSQAWHDSRRLTPVQSTNVVRESAAEARLDARSRRLRLV